MMGMLLQLTIAGLVGWAVIILPLWVTRGMEYEQVDTTDLELWRLLAERSASHSDEKPVIHYPGWEADQAQHAQPMTRHPWLMEEASGNRDRERDERSASPSSRAAR